MKTTLITFFVCLISYNILAQTTVIKTYNPGFSTSVDGCGNYCNSLPGVDFTPLDFAPGSLISDVKITISWAKTDGTCSNPDTGNSYHAETSFRLDSPNGAQVILAQPSTWSGDTTISEVTTTFSQSALLPPSGTPVDGTFLPNNGDLHDNQCDPPFGTWTLRAGDNASGAPVCITKYTVEITANDSMQVSAVMSAPVTCNGGNDGMASATATGGAPPYTYLWSNGASASSIDSLSAGTYIVTVSDSIGCEAIDSVVITEPAALVVSLDSIAVGCEGDSNGSISATVTGGITPYAFQWSNGGNGSTINSLLPGIYGVTITDDNNCTISDSGSVGMGNPLPTPHLGNDTTTSHSDPLVLNPGSFSTYLWQDGSMDSTFTATVSGTYYVEVTDSTGCVGNDTIIVNIWPLGLKAFDLKAELKVYPNPARDVINLELINMPKGEVSFYLIDLEGKEISNKAATTSGSSFNDKFDVSQLPIGVYFLRIVSSNGSLTHQVIIE